MELIGLDFVLLHFCHAERRSTSSLAASPVAQATGKGCICSFDPLLLDSCRSASFRLDE